MVSSHLGCLLLALILSTTLAHAKTPSRELVIGGVLLTPTPPYSWLDPCNGQPDGASHYILQKILEELGVEYRYAPALPMTWAGFKQITENLHSHEYDLVLGLAPPEITPDIVASSIPFITLRDAILYRKKDGHSYSALEDFKLLKGAVVSRKDSKASQQVSRWLDQQGLSYQRVSSRKAAISALMNQQADYIVLERYRAIATFLDTKMQKTFGSFPIDSGVRTLHLAIAKDSEWAQLMPRIDEKLAQFESSGRGETLRYTYLRAWLRMGDCEIP